MASYSEQFLLLSIDPVTGRPFPIQEKTMYLTLAGAILFDASFGGLINDDYKQLSILQAEETNNTAVNEALRCLKVVDQSIPLEKAIALVATHGSTLHRMVAEKLENQGSLSRKKLRQSNKTKQTLFSPDLKQVAEIHSKIRNTIINEELPDAEMPPIISLMMASGLTKYVLNSEEKEKYQKKISWLAGMESLGREIIRLVNQLKTADIDSQAANLIGLNCGDPKTYAGGMDAVLTSLTFLYKEVGIKHTRKIIANLNQKNGFECPGCAWPNLDNHRGHFAFCENGAKNVSAEATSQKIDATFFEKWSVEELLNTPGYWLEKQGRLTEPMYLDEKSTHYKPISWENAFKVVADELNKLDNPDDAVFYASGRTSNEAAFMYQLFARAYGSNNLPNSANLCHEPSGKALTMALGAGKSSVTLNDFPKADAIFLFGHNPGSNHPRMLSTLQEAARNGSQIVAINPLPEASLMGFADPQEASSYFGKQTQLTRLYIQPKINGDMAFVRGMVKAILEEEKLKDNILDNEFIKKYTKGFEVYKQTVIETPWDLLVASSGVEKKQIKEAAKIYMEAEKVITSWCLGITHHRNSVETIQEIINLQLLKGNIGKPGAGICPVRGHSNIQGVRTAGVGENMPGAFLDAMEKRFSIKVPRKIGLNAIQAVRAMKNGQVKALISLGGNLASAVPDTAYIEQALRNCNLTVMISTKLNRSHLVTGKKALILPCLSRTNKDIKKGKEQTLSIEDAMGKVSFSNGCLPAASPALKSEVSIVAGMAKATLDKATKIEWDSFENDYQYIRATISETIPIFNELEKKAIERSEFYLENPLQKRIFKTPDGKAAFSNNELETVVPKPEELLLMTIRSHDQFNTSVFGLNDRYRGISSERRILFMNDEDMSERKIFPEQLIEITSNFNNISRKLEGYYAIPYPIKKGCVAAYFPETNVLTSIDNTNRLCETPAYKSVCVEVLAVN